MLTAPAGGREHAFQRVVAAGDFDRPTYIVYTDASPYYLGGVCIDPRTGRRWWFSVPTGPGDADRDI